MLRTLATGILDILIPPRCIGCGERELWLCHSCRAQLPPLPDEHCRICAKPLIGVSVCVDCYRDPPPVEVIHAPLLHEGLARKMVLDLKYKGHRHLAAELASLMAAAVPRDFDAVVPVPLHPSRQKERGFNQSELLARHVSQRLRLPLAALLRRTRATPSQTGLSPADRAANVRGAFEAVDRLREKRLLLVDDVTTTGATLYAAARALKRAGANNVVSVTATRAALPHS